MKKLLFLLILPVQFSFSNTTKEVQGSDQAGQSGVNPLQCCTRRMSSGTYGQPDYNQVSVTRCATSTVSYQDALARACTLAAASAEQALSIAASAAGSVTIGG